MNSARSNSWRTVALCRRAFPTWSRPTAGLIAIIIVLLASGKIGTAGLRGICLWLGYGSIAEFVLQHPHRRLANNAFVEAVYQVFPLWCLDLHKQLPSFTCSLGPISSFSWRYRAVIGLGGVYSVAAGLTMPLIIVPYAVQTVFFPRASAQSDEDANRSTPFYFRQLVLVMTSLAIVAALLSHPVLLLFGGSFVAGQVPMLILLVATILRGTGGILSVHVLGRGRIGSHDVGDGHDTWRSRCC